MVARLQDLIQDGRALLFDAVRQELPSRIKRADQFSLLRDALTAFVDVALTANDYVRAADCFNRCRASGIQGANTDFLPCAVSLERNPPIFSIDHDFREFAKVLPLSLYTRD